MVKVMAVNAGSSSLKFQLINMPSEEVITSGLVERIGQEVGNFVIKVNGEKIQTQTPIPDHQVAVDLLLNALVDHHIVESLEEIDAVGHRVVHGGEDFDDSVVVDEEAVKKVADLSELAPLHNPANIIGYKAFKEALPDHVGHVFVFDTAFHQTLDKERYLYPLPMEYYKDLKVDSPYNTYKNKGLPPAPICNPTVSSVEAAYHPADTEYLFFVTKGGGEHFFSKTYKEHLDFQKNK